MAERKRYSHENKPVLRHRTGQPFTRQAPAHRPDALTGQIPASHSDCCADADLPRRAFHQQADDDFSGHTTLC